jgi:molybdopterin synthase sulfur carrier subunit
MIRVVLPSPLRALARVDGELRFDIDGQVTQRALLDSIEERFPMLQGTIRDRQSHRRRPFIRFFACARDLSHEPLDAVLPLEVVAGNEPFLIVGAMSGG